MSVVVSLKIKLPVIRIFGLLKPVNFPTITAWLKYYL